MPGIAVPEPAAGEGRTEAERLKAPLSPRATANRGFSLALGLLLLIGVAAYASLQRLITADRLVTDTQEFTTTLEGLTTHLGEAEGAVRAYVITGRESYLARFEQSVRQLTVQLRALRGRSARNSVRAERLQPLEPLLARRIDAFRATVAARGDPRTPAIEIRRLTEYGADLSDQIRSVARGIERQQQAALADRAAAASRSAVAARIIIVLAVLLGVLVVAAAMVMVNRDLRARARAAAALHEAQERSRVVLNTAKDGILAFDEHGTIEGLNPAAARIFGYAEAELVGASLTTLLAGPGASEPARYLSGFPRPGEPQVPGGTVEVSGLRRDGSIFPIELSLGEVQLPHQRLFTGVIRDITERRRLEDTLGVALELQRAILDSANNSIISTDTDGVIQSFNATAERWLGYRADELIGRQTPAIFHVPEEIARRAEELTAEFGTPIAPGFDAFAEEARRGRRSQREWTYVRKDGSRFPVLLSVAALRDASGLVAGFLGIASDLTEQRAAEEARQASEARYRSVVEVLGEGIIVQERSGRIVEANASAERILGCARETFVGRSVAETPWQTVREDNSPLPPGECPASVALRTGQPVRNAVIGAIRPDGRLAWLLVNVQPLAVGPDGRPAAAVSSFADITRRREAEEALQENQARLQDFLDNAHDFIVSTAADGRLQYVNRAWELGLGYRSAEVLGRPLFEFLAGECLERCRAIFTRVLAGETVTDIEAIFVARDGRHVTVFGSSNCRFEDGRPVATRSIFRDITEIQRTQLALERARDEAQRASRAKSDFLANMSHELRTPLNSVIGFAGVLLTNRGGNLGEQDLDFLGRIQDNGKHLLGLINSILDLSKIEAGKVELEIADVRLEDLVRDTLSLVGGVAHGEGRRVGDVEVVGEAPPGLRPIRADAAKLRQVLLNLIGNALKFTERGRITLRVVADAATGDAVRIDVQDTGIGIPPERQATIFEAFQQADASTARKYGGTGLGLTISRSLLNLMGYGIALESEVGRGSTFSVLLRSPVVRAPAPEPAPAAAAPPAPAAVWPGRDEFRGRTILVIDDEADSRLLLEHMIGDHGARVLVAASGSEGLRLARAERPDLITVDLMMPEMSGWDVVQALQADPELRHIPAVVVSIVAEERGGTVRGAEGLINKPVSREQLLSALRRHLPPTDRAD